VTDDVERSRQTNVDDDDYEQRSDGTKDDVEDCSVDKEINTVYAECGAFQTRQLASSATIFCCFHLHPSSYTRSSVVAEMPCEMKLCVMCILPGDYLVLAGFVWVFGVFY